VSYLTPRNWKSATVSRENAGAWLSQSGANPLCANPRRSDSQPETGVGQGRGQRRAPEKSKNRLSHHTWKSRKVRGIPTFPPPRRRLREINKSGHFICYKNRTFSLAKNREKICVLSRLSRMSVIAHRPSLTRRSARGLPERRQSAVPDG
jgi:hypothetical protein